MANDRTLEDAMYTSLPRSPMPLSSNFGSHNGSAPDLERSSSRSSTWQDKINEIYLQLPLFLQNVSRIETCVQTLSQTMAAITTTVEDALHTSLPWLPPLSSNVGSPHGSGHDLDGMGTRSRSTLDEKLDALLSKVVHVEAQIAQIPALTTWMSRMDSHISKTLGDFASRLTEMEQNFSAITARMCKFETYAASASNVSGSARSWPTLEHVDGSTAAGSHGPGSSDDNRNTRRRLDPSSSAEDEQSRSAVLFRFPCEQYLKGVTQWIDTLWDESGMLARNKPTRIHCKAGSLSVRLVFDTRGKYQDFVVRYKDDGILYTINSCFCCANTTITVRQSRSIEDREIGKQFVPLWKELADELKVFFPDADDNDPKSSASKIAETALENQFSNLPHLVADKRFLLVASDLSVPGISHEVLQRILSQANRPHV